MRQNVPYCHGLSPTQTFDYHPFPPFDTELINKMTCSAAIKVGLPKKYWPPHLLEVKPRRWPLPAIDRRDHEWQARVRTPTHLNLMSFGEYAKDKGWRR